MLGCPLASPASSTPSFTLFPSYNKFWLALSVFMAGLPQPHSFTHQEVAMGCWRQGCESPSTPNG